MTGDRPSEVVIFFGSLWGKVLSGLTVVTLVLGIYVEIIAAWRGTNEARISESNVARAKAEACSARQKASARWGRTNTRVTSRHKAARLVERA